MAKINIEKMAQNVAEKAIQELRDNGVFIGRWIPVSEKMPEPNRLVLCYITTGTTETYYLALRNEYYDDWEEGVGGSRMLGKDLGCKVLAWMPLPKPYEPQESEDT